MRRAQSLLVNRQRTFVEWLRLRILALIAVQLRQIVQTRRDQGMLWPKHFFQYCQRTFVEWFSLRILTLCSVQLCQVVQARGHIGMLRAKGFL